jgi:phosphohistidine phosphatase
LNLYLIRHGEAEKSSEKKSDDARELTPLGIQTVEISSLFWKNLINKLDIIFSSPLKRAIQTAEIVKKSFKVEKEILIENSLLNGGLTEDILNVVSAYGNEDTALVGHQPDMAAHISRMIGHNEINLRIPPSTIAKISFNNKPMIGEGKLEFLIPPTNKKG